MRKLAIMLVVVLSIMILAPSIQKAKADDIGTATIYPESGDIYTRIFLRVSNFSLTTDAGGSWPNYWRNYFKLYVFWDSMPIITGLDDTSWVFETYFNPPNEYTYSETGNHTIYIEVWVYGAFSGVSLRTNFTLTFNILKYYPPADMFMQWWNNLTESQREQLRGPQGIQGPQGVQGPIGTQGPTGPQGQQGIQGVQGSQGYQGVQGPKGDTGTTGPKGDTGTQGPQGLSGVNGINGTRWLNGTSTPSNNIGVNGDMYLDTETSNIYNKISGAWLLVGNIKGIQGEVGPIGPYPVEAVTLTILMSSLAIVCAVIALILILRKPQGV